MVQGGFERACTHVKEADRLGGSVALVDVVLLKGVLQSGGDDGAQELCVGRPLARPRLPATRGEDGVELRLRRRGVRHFLDACREVDGKGNVPDKYVPVS